MKPETAAFIEKANQSLAKARGNLIIDFIAP